MKGKNNIKEQQQKKVAPYRSVNTHIFLIKILQA